MIHRRAWTKTSPTLRWEQEGMKRIDPRDITPEHIYLSRRKFMTGAAALTTAAILAGCGIDGGSGGASTTAGSPGSTGAATDELGLELTSYEAVTSYNNFYEFTVDKEKVAEKSAGFVTEPWTLEVGGLVESPRTFSIDELLAEIPEDERI
jgi:sulfoxide reductase catalytic subunit YedY